MKTLLKLATLILAFQIISVSIYAQENTSPKKRSAQFTFFYPLGSNGVESPQYSNSFSLNAIVGINGGVHGAEIGGVLNYNHNEVIGAQVGGVANINRLNSHGAMIAGVVNFTGENSHGFQLSTINFAAGEFTGFQLGVINITKRLNGVQLGVINVVEDGDKALSIGLINVVKNGHYELELSVSEMLTANMNFKMGVERLYTIFKIAYVVNQDDHLYSAGIGVGSLVTLKGRHMLSIDASASQLYNQTIWEEKESHLIARMDLLYKYWLTDRFSLMAGPAYSLYATNASNNDGGSIVNTPTSFYSKETDKGKVSMWLGFTAGISISL